MDENVTNIPQTETPATTEHLKISFVKSAIYNLSVLCCFKRRNIEIFLSRLYFWTQFKAVEFNKKAESVIAQFEHAAMYDTWELRQRT